MDNTFYNKSLSPGNQTLPSLGIILCTAALLAGGLGWHFYAEKAANEAMKAGNLAYLNEDWRAALKDYTQAIQLRSNYAEAYGKRAEVRMELDDLKGSEVDARIAVSLNPKDREYLFNLAAVESNVGELTPAVKDYTDGILLLPSSFDGYMYRAMAEAKVEGETASALSDFSRAIVDSGYEEGLPYRSRALFYDDLGQDKEALDDYQVALDKGDLDISSQDYTHFRIWILLARHGKTEQATQYLSDYLDHRSNPNDWPGRVGAFLAGKLSEAEFIRDAEDPDPVTKSGQTCEAYFYSGTVRLLNGDKAMAATYFQKSIDSNKLTFEEYYSSKMALARLRKVDSYGEASPIPAEGVVSSPTPTPVPVVDVPAILDGLAAKRPDHLDWKRSTVALLRLVGLDSSLVGRKELAHRLGYTGDVNDTAALNRWLHEAVLKKIADSGGKVPNG